jgi:hypothetical protein
MIEEIATDVYDITVAKRTGARYRVFLFEGEAPTLVDAGFADTVDVVADRLDELGVASEKIASFVEFTGKP